MKNNSKIVSKHFSHEWGVTIFVISQPEGYVRYTAEEISHNKSLLHALEVEDVYNVGFTRGVESILVEPRFGS